MRKVKNNGFTLLELLIVIAVIAILSVIVILVLNPAETLKKARDSQRMADLNTIKTAIGLYITSTGTPYLGANGTSNTGCGTGAGASGHVVWYSKYGPVTDNTLDGTGTVASSSASQATAGNVDGTGWIPVNLSSLTGGSPISNWPIDPTNSITSLSSVTNADLVYRYGCLSSSMTFEVDAKLESESYTVQDNKLTSDGGNNTLLYEVGTNLSVLGSGNDF
jgi:prepilin-type N-terminal cleavage/methylation domain-containing protein